MYGGNRSIDAYMHTRMYVYLYVREYVGLQILYTYAMIWIARVGVYFRYQENERKIMRIWIFEKTSYMNTYIGVDMGGSIDR